MNILILMPFVILLLSLSFAPLLIPNWWKSYSASFILFLSLIIILYYLLQPLGFNTINHVLREYFNFISFIICLFIITSGIYIKIRGQATPIQNVLFLMFGILLSNILGSTGSSILLIKPWLEINKQNFFSYHGVFFIILIGNIGACLTPIADAPLLVGFLHGVPFLWTLKHLSKIWLLSTTILLIIFFVIDYFCWHKFKKISCPIKVKNIFFKGKRNFLPLCCAVLFSCLNETWRIIMICLTVFFSWYITPRCIYKKANFSIHSLQEIACLFFGIFITMTPFIERLESDFLLISLTSTHFYYLSGLLSALLDNTPTYFVFLSIAVHSLGGFCSHPSDVLHLAVTKPSILMAISIGSVFFGSLTYIGNTPNLLIKNYLEIRNVKIPNFFSYTFCYAIPLLLPLFILIGFIFFH